MKQRIIDLILAGILFIEGYVILGLIDLLLPTRDTEMFSSLLFIISSLVSLVFLGLSLASQFNLTAELRRKRIVNYLKINTSIQIFIWLFIIGNPSH